VNLLFWGDAWNTAPPPSPTMSQVVSDVASILAGGYQARIVQYGATGAALGNVFVSIPGNNPPTNYTKDDVAKFITGAISSGALPEPDELGSEVLHCVFMPPGTTPPPNLGGEHSYALYSAWDSLVDVDINERSHFAWVAFGTRAQISTHFSHELVESLSDPEGDGIQVNPRNDSSWHEIGDACTSTGVLNGVTVQSYWSQSDKACVIPANVSLQMQIGRNGIRNLRLMFVIAGWCAGRRLR
jgi:hypothetical protein